MYKKKGFKFQREKVSERRGCWITIVECIPLAFFSAYVYVNYMCALGECVVTTVKGEELVFSGIGEVFRISHSRKGMHNGVVLSGVLS